jgi:hypothetical protein
VCRCCKQSWMRQINSCRRRQPSMTRCAAQQYPSSVLLQGRQHDTHCSHILLPRPLCTRCFSPKSLLTCTGHRRRAAAPRGQRLPEAAAGHAAAGVASSMFCPMSALSFLKPPLVCSLPAAVARSIFLARRSEPPAESQSHASKGASAASSRCLTLQAQPASSSITKL